MGKTNIGEELYKNNNITVRVCNAEIACLIDIFAEQESLYKEIDEIDIKCYLTIEIQNNEGEYSKLDFNKIKLSSEVEMLDVTADKVDFADIDVQKYLNKGMKFKYVDDLEDSITLDTSKQKESPCWDISGAFPNINMLDMGALGVSTLDISFLNNITGNRIYNNCKELMTLDLSSIKQVEDRQVGVKGEKFFDVNCKTYTQMHSLNEIIVSEELAYIVVQIMRFNEEFNELYNSAEYEEIEGKCLIGYGTALVKDAETGLDKLDFKAVTTKDYKPYSNTITDDLFINAQIGVIEAYNELILSGSIFLNDIEINLG